MNYESFDINDNQSTVDSEVVDYILNNTTREVNGRLLMPLPWRQEALHLLGTNYWLAKKILNSNLKKVQNNSDKLKIIDNVFQEQIESGIIEKIPNVQEYVKCNPDSNFLAHMAVFRPGSISTKCRVVFLSNLNEKSADKDSLSHNQVLHAGPSLNQKITTALMHLRFGEYMLTYDLKKAFNQISLSRQDSNRLLFLWFNDVSRGDYSIVGFRNLRLSFGLRPSPTVLMLGLYKILCLDSTNDTAEIRQLKLLLYGLLYMDNGAMTGTKEEVLNAYHLLPSIFASYKFDLQQFACNIDSIQTEADESSGESTLMR